jgi:predicted alpha/beta-hydrolase family hydrolase
LRIPALFVQGSEDPFGSLEELGDAIKLIPAPVELLPVERAAHDLKRAGDMGEELLKRLRGLKTKTNT